MTSDSENLVTETAKAATFAQVLDYLDKHQDFFHDPRTDVLLETMQIPHRHRGTISLLEHQIEVLKHTNRENQKHMDDLISINENNVHTVNGFVAVLNAIFDAMSLKELLEGFPDWWQQPFDEVDEVKLVLPSGTCGKQLAALSDNIALYNGKNPPVEIANSQRSGKHQFGDKMSQELSGLFTSTQLGSYLLLSGTFKQNGGILLGSNSPERFVQDQNADIALIVSYACIQRVLDVFTIDTLDDHLQKLNGQIQKQNSNLQKQNGNLRKLIDAHEEIQKHYDLTKKKPIADQSTPATTAKPATAAKAKKRTKAKSVRKSDKSSS